MRWEGRTWEGDQEVGREEKEAREEKRKTGNGVGKGLETSGLCPSSDRPGASEGGQKR